jgi:hypothetical protein
LIERAARLFGEGVTMDVNDVEELKPGYVLVSGTVRGDGSPHDLFVLAQVSGSCIRMLESHPARERALATVGQ